MKILFLTNIQNGAPEEDCYLVEALGNHFDIITSHPLECERYLTSVQGVVIRNIWPTSEYAIEWSRIERVITASGLPTYNPLTGKGDNLGKKYLVDLYQKGFPVIPSVASIEDVNKLPESDYYWIKPEDSCDGQGDEKLSLEELKRKNPKGYIIQPFEEFASEPSFFFIDNVFSYAISMPNRLADRDITFYEPTREDLVFAQKFVDWEELPYGIQRVDAVRTKDGNLLLTEDEDIAEYLYLLDLPRDKREVVTTQVVASIKKNITK
jgi:hypothetical protein